MVAQINDNIVNPVAIETKEMDFVKIISQSKEARGNFIKNDDIKATRANLPESNVDSAYDGASGALNAELASLKNSAKNVSLFADDFVNEPGYAGEILSNIGAGVKKAGGFVAEYVSDMATNDPLKFTKDAHAFTMISILGPASLVSDEYANYKIASENGFGNAYLGATAITAASSAAILSLEAFSGIKPLKAAMATVKRTPDESFVASADLINMQGVIDGNNIPPKSNKLKISDNNEGSAKQKDSLGENEQPSAEKLSSYKKRSEELEIEISEIEKQITKQEDFISKEKITLNKISNNDSEEYKFQQTKLEAEEKKLTDLNKEKRITISSYSDNQTSIIFGELELKKGYEGNEVEFNKLLNNEISSNNADLIEAVKYYNEEKKKLSDKLDNFQGNKAIKITSNRNGNNDKVGIISKNISADRFNENGFTKDGLLFDENGLNANGQTIDEWAASIKNSIKTNKNGKDVLDIKVSLDLNEKKNIAQENLKIAIGESNKKIQELKILEKELRKLKTDSVSFGEINEKRKEILTTRKEYHRLSVIDERHTNENILLDEIINMAKNNK